MPSYRFHIIVWQDPQRQYTAAMLDDPVNVAAVGSSASEAKERLEDYLRWLAKNQPWSIEPVFTEPQLLSVKVEVRPEYIVQNRPFPCAQGVPLRVVCVQGKDQYGMLLGCLPTLGISFTCNEEANFKSLVGHYVQSALKSVTPQQLSRCLPPQHCQLDQIIVQVRSKAPRRADPAPPRELAAVCDPVGHRAFRARLSHPWERDAELNRLILAARDEKANVILVGPNGVGKTALLVEAVRQIERRPAATTNAASAPDSAEAENPAEPVQKRRFWLTSAARLIAGMRYLGQWQERCEKMIAELAEFDGALCIENLLDLVNTGGEGALDSLAAFLVPYLQRRELRLIAEATPAEIDACRRLLPGFVELFNIINVEPLAGAHAVSALERVAAAHERNLNIHVERGTIEQVHRLFARFMPYRGFPGAAASFINALFEEAALHSIDRITPAMAVSRFIRVTGLPEMILNDDVPLARSAVLDSLRASVIGQDDACLAVANVITAFKAGLNDPNRPIAVLLFCGPTGVGKTELARTLAKFLFGHGDDSHRMERLDMSEYADRAAAERLLGDPSGQPGHMIARLRQQPFNVLLLDEIEKADPAVFDLFLGVFDEGRLTDRCGRLTTFRSAVIIMTSNLGAGAAEPFGLAKDRAAAPAYESVAGEFFRPEFFNRLDAVVTFNPLAPSIIEAIAVKELNALAQREGLHKTNLTLAWTARLVAHLAANGYDIRYGARPLQRMFELQVVPALSKFILEHPGLRDRAIELDLDESSRVRIAIKD